MAAEFGVRDDVSFIRDDGASVQFASHAGTTRRGRLIVNGLDVPECITNPPPIDPDAMGAPGCSGIDQVPLCARAGDRPEHRLAPTSAVMPDGLAKTRPASSWRGLSSIEQR